VLGRVESARPLHAGAVRAVERAEILGVGGATGLGVGPGAQRGEPARRADPQRLELVDQREERPEEARGARGRPEDLERCPPDCGDGDPLPRELAERPPGDPTAACELALEALRREHLRAEDEAAARKLAAVAIDVGQGRHDEQRLARGGRDVRVDDDPRLLRVGRSGDEGERQGTCMVATGGDDLDGLHVRCFTPCPRRDSCRP